MSGKLERNLGEIGRELNFWQSLGKELIKEKIACLFDKVRPEDTGYQRSELDLFSARVYLTQGIVPPRLKDLTRPLFKRNPQGELDLFFRFQRSELVITNSTERFRIHVCGLVSDTTEFIETSDGSTNDRLSYLSPSLRFMLARELINTILNNCQIQNPQETQISA